MMSKKQLACMLTLHIIYLLLGASIFYHIESPVELSQRADEELERLEIQNLLYENYSPADPEIDQLENILQKLSVYCGKSLYNGTEEETIKWDFYHSFFFSYTVVSTIGYGNLAPTTHLSRILMIFYALFGIPINGILLANLGEYFGLQLISVYRRYKRRNEKRADNLSYIFQKFGLLGQILLYMVPGFLFFMFLPACLFVLFEGWDFVASVYYAFVTLTTIGFGDLVAGTTNNGFASGYFVAYQIFLIVWITFGLGYIVMLLGFITSGMRSESVHKIEQKLANQLKSTQNRILQGFTRDVAVIRKLINEANLIKIKPVYVEYTPTAYRSKSCPTFTFDIEERDPIVKRKRANSENIYLSTKDLLRIQSDTDLLGIDKEKTFNTTALVRPAELLARVVNVLGGFEVQREEKGVHMFEDDEILATEKSSIWSIGPDQIITNSPKRTRALSVAVSNFNNEMSSDPDKMVYAMNKRPGKMSLPTSIVPNITSENEMTILSSMLRKQSEANNPAEYLKNTMKGRVSIAQGASAKPKARRGSIFPTFNTSTSDDEDAEAARYREITKKGRRSIFPTFDFNQDDEEEKMAKKYREKTKRGRHSIFPTFDFNQDVDEDEDEKMAKAYRDLTKKGRKSIFPTFDFSENENDNDLEAAAKKYRDRGKRHSIFPTFDFSENDEDDMAKKYKETTKRGRKSIFPSFDFSSKDKDIENDEEDDTIDEDEVRKYQNKTRSGRLSLFPSFGKKKKDKDIEKEEEDDTIDEEEVRKYQNKTRSGRLSMFPSFGKKKKDEDIEKEEEDDTIDEEEVRKYQNKTRSGRLSFIPSFGKKKKDEDSEKGEEDDTIDEEEVKKYQNKTKSGRLSFIPSFGKKKNDEDTEMPETSEEIEKYQNKTKKGRGSLFAGFSNRERRQSNASADDTMSDLEASIRQYQNQTNRGRKSLFDPSLDVSELREEEQVEALEQTSVADLLRALAVIETALPQGRRGSNDSVGLLDLLAGQAVSSAPHSRRRGSLHPEFALPKIPSRSEVEDTSGPRRRRVSARSATPHFTPTLATVVAGAELQTTAKAARENRMNMLADPPPPPYTATDEALAPARMRKYSPAPAHIGRASSGPVPRMFSKIRKDSNTNSPSASAEGSKDSSRRGSLTDIVIDKNTDNT